MYTYASMSTHSQLQTSTVITGASSHWGFHFVKITSHDANYRTNLQIYSANSYPGQLTRNSSTRTVATGSWSCCTCWEMRTFKCLESSTFLISQNFPFEPWHCILLAKGVTSWNFRCVKYWNWNNTMMRHLHSVDIDRVRNLLKRVARTA